jgi:hypothetical protein
VWYTRYVAHWSPSVVITALSPATPCVLYGHLSFRPIAFCTFRVILCGEFGRVGEAGKGVWGKTWNRAARGARGVPGFPPVHFRIGPPSCLFTRVAEP